MRAARLLQIVLLLQNRGRMTSAALARALEVAPRTILRDLDAMTEAGLPVIVHRGREGGIELGFDYRTRLTGLDREEAEAMGLLLSLPMDRLAAFGLEAAGRRAAAKIWEAFPDQTRAEMAKSRSRFTCEAAPDAVDPRCPALARAVRDGVVVRLRMRAPPPQEVHPIGLSQTPKGWHLRDAITGQDIPDAEWGDINISAHRFSSCEENST
ncbi:helix-turn-helix transcriptional regulator [Candidatus Rhodobacter oscarellae]|nr:HTH domain-containing protein [Candidatus Rhodobacter lobularis]